MTWNAITPERMIELVQYLINQDWPLDSDGVAAAMAGQGWEKDADGLYEADLPLNMPNLMETGSESEYGLNTVSWNLTDVVREGSVERDAFMNDAFVGFVKTASALWGKPKRMRYKEFVAAQWDIADGCRVRVSNRHSAVSVYINSPSYAQVLRRSERR